MVKKEVIGKVQLILGILILLVAIITITYIKITYDAEVKSITDELLGQAEYYNTYNFTSDETKLITLTNIGLSYSLELTDIRTKYWVLESLSIMALIISLLFIAQGMINLKK